nr:ATP synthase F0 subunit 8 [Taenianotus triacanthus]
MPQLNPKPWLMVLLLSWTCFLTLVPLKVIGHLFPNPNTSRSAVKKVKDRWTWPWS